MAAPETNIVNAIMKSISPSGARLFRNVRGSFYTLDSVRALIGAALSMNTGRIKEAITGLRQLMAGLLVPGGSDLVGFRPVIITPEMVGKKIAIFSVVEVKTETGRVSPEQAHFVAFVKENGGFAGVARSPEDARKIMQIPLDSPA